MTVVLFRHGPAGTRRPGAADEARPLTKDGRRRTRECARGLARLGPAPRTIVSSPLTRARQTAEILAQVLGGRRRVRLDDRLRPEGATAAADGLVTDAAEGGLVLVGHEPHLSRVARRWLGCGGGLALKKAGACGLEWHGRPGAATLLWLATPRLLRRAGR